MSSEKIVLRTNDGFDIVGRFTVASNTTKVVIFAHGLTSDNESEPPLIEVEKRLSDFGLSTLFFDFRCHGKSSGVQEKDFTITGQIIDIETVVHFLHEKGYENLGLVAASFGGGAAAIYCEKYSDMIHNLCLVNPVLNYTSVFLNPTTEWARRHLANAEERIEEDGYVSVGSRKFRMGKILFDEMKEFKPGVSLQKFDHPLLLIHGDNDNTVDHMDTYNVFVNLPSVNKELEIIQGGEHGFHNDPFTIEVAELITDFFVTRLK